MHNQAFRMITLGILLSSTGAFADGTVSPVDTLPRPRTGSGTFLGCGGFETVAPVDFEAKTFLHADMFTAERSSVDVNENEIRVNQGHVLVYARRPTTVLVKGYRFGMRRKSALVVRIEGDEVAAVNLLDFRNGSIRISNGVDAVNMDLGHALTMSPTHSPTLELISLSRYLTQDALFVGVYRSRTSENLISDILQAATAQCSVIH